jgi:DNA-directed RNA polymerase subunit RPC12/RpoP
MGERTSLDKQAFYICGQCGDKQHYLITENPPIPCPDCGWYHQDKKKNDVPAEYKLDLTSL